MKRFDNTAKIIAIGVLIFIALLFMTSVVKSQEVISGNRYFMGKVGINTKLPATRFDLKSVWRHLNDTTGYIEFRVPLNADSMRYTWPGTRPDSTRYLVCDTNGVMYWAAGGGTGGGGLGTVTSISGGWGLSLSPSPITTTGSIGADTALLATVTDITRIPKVTSLRDSLGLVVRNTGGNYYLRSLTAKLGVLTAVPTKDISLGGNAARTFGMERHTTSNTAGNSISINGGGATVGATNKAGGGVNFYDGIGTGVSPKNSFTWYTTDNAAASPGTADQAQTAKMMLYSSGNLGIGTLFPLAKLSVNGDFWLGTSTNTTDIDSVLSISTKMVKSVNLTNVFLKSTDTTTKVASRYWVGLQGFLTAEVDGSVTNEGSLTVGAGGANTSTIISNTSGSTAVTISGNSTTSVTESGSTITVKVDTSLIATQYDISGFLSVESDPVWISDSTDYLHKSDTNTKVASRYWVQQQAYLTAEVDGSVSNEGSLSVGAGASNTSTIVSNTSASTDVTLSGSSTILVTEGGNTITLNADTTKLFTQYDASIADTGYVKTLSDTLYGTHTFLGDTLNILIQNNDTVSSDAAISVNKTGKGGGIVGSYTGTASYQGYGVYGASTDYGVGVFAGSTGVNAIPLEVTGSNAKFNASMYIKGATGDLNRDEMIDGADTVFLKAFLQGTKFYSDSISFGDVTGNGTVDYMDLSILKKSIDLTLNLDSLVNSANGAKSIQSSRIQTGLTGVKITTGPTATILPATSTLQVAGTTTTGGTSDYTNFEADGTMRMYGKATVYDDIRVPLFTRTTAGYTSPTFTGGFAGNAGLWVYEFGGGTIANSLFAEVQMPHSWAGDTIWPHFHWSPTTTGDGNVIWNVEYTMVEIGGTFNNSTTHGTLSTAATAAGGTAWVHKITGTSSPIVPTTSQDGLSTVLVIRIYRNPTGSDTYADDAALVSFDIHFKINKIGSRGETTD